MELDIDGGMLEVRLVGDEVAVSIDKSLEDNGEFLAEDVITEAGKEVEEEMTTADVAVDVEVHLPFYLLPLGYHFVSLESVVPSLQLYNIKFNEYIISCITDWI